jgi:hypothetical protein
VRKKVTMSTRKQRTLMLQDFDVFVTSMMPVHRNRHHQDECHEEQPKPLDQKHRRQRRPPKGSFPSHRDLPPKGSFPSHRDLPAGSFPVMPPSPTSNDNNENHNKANHLKFRGSMKSHSNRTAQYNRHRSKKHDIKSSSPHHSVASSNGSHCNSHKFGSSIGGGTTTSSVTSRSSRRSSIGQQIEAMRARILRRGDAVHPVAPVTEFVASVDWSGIGNSDSEDELPLISEFNIDYKHHKYYDELVDNYFQDALSSVSSPPLQENRDAVSSRRRAPRIIDSQQFEI